MAAAAKVLGRILAIDPGTKRIGYAVSDELGLTVQPLEVWSRAGLAQDLSRLKRLIEEYEVVELLLGLPLRMDGSESPSTERARVFGEAVRAEFPSVPLSTRDETLTTWAAEERLAELGVPRKLWKQKVDAFAAAALLEEELEARRSNFPTKN